MLNIYFISNDDRIDRLIEHFQPFFKTRIRKASDFDHGLKEVFENRPSAVFIQSDIGSVSGETVARHIKSLLGSDSPRIIFMGGDGARRKTADSWCDDWVPLGDSEQEFQQGFRALVERYYPKEWRYISAEIERTAKRSPDTAPEGWKAESDRGLPAPPAPGNGADPIAGGVAGGTVVAGVEGPACSSGDENGLQEKVLPTDEPARKQRLALETFTVHDASLEAGGTTSGIRVWKLLLLVLLVAGGAVYCWRDYGNRKTAEPGPLVPEKAAPPPVTAGAIKGLPSYVRPEWRDPTYSEGHAGWERYVSPEYEFRLYRENSVIKALQVISLTDKGISGQFALSMLQEFGYTAPLPAGVDERREGFIVKRFVIKGVAELATYREEGSGRIKAMVLELL